MERGERRGEGAEAGVGRSGGCDEWQQEGRQRAIDMDEEP